MLVQLQPVQVSLLWETIRHSVVKANKVPADLDAKYSNRLLANLLNGKYQCWVIFEKEDDQRKIIAVGVTALIEEHLYSARTLYCLSLYGFRALTQEIADDSFAKLKEYAKHNGCCKVTMQTGVPRMKQLIEAQGLISNTTLYELYI